MASSSSSSSSAGPTLVVVLLLAAAAVAPGGAAVDQKTCMPKIYNLLPCLDYIQNNSTPAAPPSNQCCLELAQVVQSQPLCLCAILDGEASSWLGIPVDPNRALTLPGACNVRTPPVSQCNDSSIPPSPSSGPSRSSSIPGTPSDGSPTKSAPDLLLPILFISPLILFNFHQLL